MASEIRVDKINSLSGVGTVTLSPTGVDISGITTAATLKATTGIVTTLTATTGIVTTFEATTGNITTLRAPTGIVTSLEATTGDITTLRAPTGIVTSLEATTGDITTLRAPTGIVTTFVTNTANVGAAVTISESGIEASGIGITVANINGGAVSGRRNMIINGDQRIAQRGTTAKLATTTAAYKCVDRFKTDIDSSGGGDFYHAQTGTGTSISADVPTGQGFTHSSKITVNTSASQPTSESNHSQIYTMLEQQDVYHLEWGTSAAKTCTLSFWVKSSVAGTYTLWMSIYTTSATQYYWTNYTINSVNTWEKKVITLTGPTSGGNLSGSLNGTGLRIEWTLGVGSDSETGTLNEWTTSSTFRTAPGSVYLNENAGATWLMTGAQFEVGSQATAFEHRSFGEELGLCQRYYYKHVDGNTKTVTENGTHYTGAYIFASFTAPTAMRTAPSLEIVTGSAYYVTHSNGQQTQTFSGTGVISAYNTENYLSIQTSEGGGTQGHATIWRTNNASARIAYSAEL